MDINIRVPKWLARILFGRQIAVLHSAHSARNVRHMRWPMLGFAELNVSMRRVPENEALDTPDP